MASFIQLENGGGLVELETSSSLVLLEQTLAVVTERNVDLFEVLERETLPPFVQLSRHYKDQGLSEFTHIKLIDFM